MGKVHAPEFITPFSPFWWGCILIVGLISFVIVRIPLHWKNLKRRNKLKQLKKGNKITEADTLHEDVD